MENKKNKKKISFRYNISEYWSFLKKYKLLFFATLFFTLLVESFLLIDKFLFKIIIDNGTEFVNGSLAQEIFINTLIIVAGVFVGILIVRTISKWLSMHVLQILEGNLIRKF